VRSARSSPASSTSEADTIALSVADAAGATGRFAPRTGRFRVAYVFRTNFSEYDTEWVLRRPRGAAQLSAVAGQANVIEVKPRLDRRHGASRAAIGRAAGNGYSVSDWRSMNGTCSRRSLIQQTALFLVIGLIVAVVDLQRRGDAQS
jgi:ABC-type lipoprotein release transport system permease subunit